MSRLVAPCRLCQEVRPLCESHLLARKFYKLLHEPGNPKHVVIGTGRLHATTRQVREYLFCEECEERFNSRGERWVIANTLQTSGSFPLRDVLRAAKPTVELQESMAYSGNTPGVDLDRIVYFAVSMFWRASVGKWALIDRWFGSDHKADFGRLYNKQLGLFLLDQGPFPKGAALVVYVSDEDSPYAAATFPGGGRQKQGYFSYSFQVPGMMFFIVLGQSTPENIRDLCAINNPVQRLIFLTKFPEKFIEKGTAEKLATLSAAARARTP